MLALLMGMKLQGLSQDFSACPGFVRNAIQHGEEETALLPARVQAGEGQRERGRSPQICPSSLTAPWLSHMKVSNLKMSAQSLTFQTYKSVRNSLINCLQGVLYPGPLSNGMVCRCRTESTSSASSLACPLPLEEPDAEDVLGPHIFPCSTSFPCLRPPSKCFRTRCHLTSPDTHPKPPGPFKSLGSD